MSISVQTNQIQPRLMKANLRGVSLFDEAGCFEDKDETTDFETGNHENELDSGQQ